MYDKDEARRLILEIREKEREIESLKKEYTDIMPPCANTSCGWYEKEDPMHCGWTDLVTTCDEYIEEIEKYGSCYDCQEYDSSAERCKRHPEVSIEEFVILVVLTLY